ncbi:MAG: glycine/sarcosine/betaine reductase component B subunit [Aminobacterium sp.]|jgi:sarcosine reductase|uniref:Glycine reductase complex component B subunits alpha and beta n=1 Tax=bioreactor metagenome TaxID=1076179 RepID=A0A645ABC3_9ZZZZ|nr:MULTISPECIES: glycine/sarcosine/betaine reductase component B subunit [unclassified Aminobacterium]MDD2206906.1 glycine/sarcosine/betaine reductase component B subunit [Aminobacterium sp.]MDD3425548.1 glycine/sarcosine/betaine reductase component B subunit [Aminobacterium sp.]MDD3708444.1 glycine/sarcosine/betaine reductase component B subunit [Aminobacterium sp.]MDD4229615.1 glycine/sarcosine/betaine reductase component B subunit [Aminobacterium sp.]MDD4550973.1 glycine/sarcosine/betaine r
METLKLRRIKVADVQFGSVTEIQGKTLFINKEELISLLLEDKQLQSVDVKLARPGESKRIVPVKDVIEPRTKLDEKTYTFPGFFCDPDFISGRGTTIVLDGAAIVTSGKLVNFQEGLIDMSGKGAEYSVFSKKNNIVLLFEPVPGLGKHEHERSVRNGGVKAARFIAEAVKNFGEYEEAEYPAATLLELLGSNAALPKVVYICQTIAQGLLHDNYFYGLNAQGCLPVLMNPTELMDGAVVSGNCAAPCHKHTTYHHQNNPIIEDLLSEHEKKITFLGVIVAPVRTAFVEKERICNQVFKIAQMIGAEGAIVSEDGGGNPEADLMMLTRLFEKNGIKTVLVTDEYAGSDGASAGLADVTPEADAVVTNGNGNERVILPPMDEVIGHIECVDVITGGHSGSLLPDGSVAMEIAGIMGSTNELGTENLTTWAI